VYRESPGGLVIRSSVGGAGRSPATLGIGATGALPPGSAAIGGSPPPARLGRPGSQRLDPVQDGIRHLVLGGEPDVMFRRALDHRDLVSIRVEADLRARDVVEDDRIQALALE